MKPQRIISYATLAISVVTLVLVLKRPAPVAAVLAPDATAANAQSFQEKVNQLAQPKVSGDAESEVRINSGELSAALAGAAGLLPATAPAAPRSASPLRSTRRCARTGPGRTTRATRG